jgi:hypothetical protein
MTQRCFYRRPRFHALVTAGRVEAIVPNEDCRWAMSWLCLLKTGWWGIQNWCLNLVYSDEGTLVCIISSTQRNESLVIGGRDLHEERPVKQTLSSLQETTGWSKRIAHNWRPSASERSKRIKRTRPFGRNVVLLKQICCWLSQTALNVFLKAGKCGMCIKSQVTAVAVAAVLLLEKEK